MRNLAGETLDNRGTIDSRSGTILFPLTGVTRASLAEEALAELPIDLAESRVMLTNLGISGVFGTDAPTVQMPDSKAATTTGYLRFRFPIPECWVEGEDLKVRVRGGMITTVSDTSATVDVSCYEDDEDGGISADLCETAAQSINSLTKADKDFVITSSGLAVGSMLDVRVAVAVVDGATGTAVIAELSSLKVLLDIKG